jgi:hypothetical protein
MIIKIGTVFGRLTVIAGPFKSGNNRKLEWQCRCICGNEKPVRGSNLRNGNSQSCGCLSREISRAIHTRHGEGKSGQTSPEYRTWCGIRRRCLDVNATAYSRYGGRGITIHPAWVNSFKAFLASVGRKPGPQYTIERNDNNGNYEPGNVRWATHAEQNRNYSRNRILTINGLTMCASDWADRVGLPRAVVLGRLESGWSATDAVFLPKGGKKMLELLKRFDVNRMDIEQLVELSAFGRGFEAEYRTLGLSVPEFVEIQLKSLRREIKSRVADAKESKLRQMKLNRASLRTTEEKRAELDKQIAELESEVPA